MESFFTYRPVYLTIYKLSQLVAISEVPDLAAAVTNIHIYCQNDHMLRLTETCEKLLVKAFLRLTSLATLRFINAEAPTKGQQAESDSEIPVITAFHSFEVVLRALDAARVKPKRLISYASDFRCRFTIFNNPLLSLFHECLLQVEGLQTDILFMPDIDDPQTDAAVMSRKLALGCKSLRGLKVLNLTFSYVHRWVLSLHRSLD